MGYDPGLKFRGAFGEPGDGLVRTRDQPALELELPPLQRYEVSDGRDLVRTESAEGLVLVDGDGWALPSSVLAGLLPSQPPFLLTGASNLEDLSAVLGPRTRLVLTDTNRRRGVVPNRLTGAYGPLVPADADPGPTIALEGPDDQTVLRVEGAEVTATMVGPLFGVNPSTAAENAFDGDPTTAWTFGDFGRAQGQSVSVRAPRPLRVDRIDLDVPPTTGRRIAKLRVQADDGSHEVTVPSDGRVSASFPGRTAQRLTVTVTGVEGEGDNPVSIAEVSVPGLQVRRVARLPVATAQGMQALTGSARARLGQTPADVVLSRVRGTAAVDDDEEARLDRDFTSPDARQYRIYGLVRPDRGARDDLLDTLQGVTGDVVATSSSRAFGSPTVRASRAFDGDRNTGWVPGRAVDGEWLDATFDQQRTVSRVVIEQPEQAATWVSEAHLFADGRQVATAKLSRGRVEVAFPPTRATTLRLQVEAHEGGGFPNVSELTIDGVRVTSDPAGAADRCVPIGTIDDRPVRVRLVGGVDGDGPRLVAGCEPLQLGSGEHRLRSLPGWTTDSLVLRDSKGEAAVPGTQGPDVTVDRQSPSSYRVRSDSARSPYLLVVGQNLNPGWRATMDGVPLGPPVVVDGYAMGWWVQDLGPHVFEVDYAPQAGSDVAMATSGGALILASALLLVPGRLPVAPASPAAPSAGHWTGGGRRRRRLPAWAGWLVFVLGCGVFAGLPGLVAGGGVAVWSLIRDPAPRTLLRLSVAAMALAPAAWVVGNLARWGEVSPQLVLANPAPSVLVVLSLVLLVVGSWRDGDPTEGSAPAEADPTSRPAGTPPD